MNKIGKLIAKDTGLSMIEIQTMPTEEIRRHITNVKKRCITIDEVNGYLGRVTETSFSKKTPKIKILFKKRR